MVIGARAPRSDVMHRLDRVNAPFLYPFATQVGDALRQIMS